MHKRVRPKGSMWNRDVQEVTVSTSIIRDNSYQLESTRLCARFTDPVLGPSFMLLHYNLISGLRAIDL